MSLTNADVSRIERAGQRGFYYQDEQGYLCIKNIDGHCVFLQDERCVVYLCRPEGCVLYPLIYFTESDAVGLHSFCPYRNEFEFASGDHAWLRRSIAREEAEVTARRRT
jgi:Fe-S-cluster containining protein